MKELMLSIATATTARSTRWNNVKVSWKDLVTKLSEPIVTYETVGEYSRMSKDEQGRIKDVGGFVGGTLDNGKRKSTTVLSRSVVTLDIDFAGMEFVHAFGMLYDYEAVIHSTHKHTEASPRLRLIMPLNREVSPDEYEAISRKLAEEMGMNLFDPTTFQPSRLMFYPSHPKDATYVFVHNDGEPIDADEVLSRYVNWKNVNEWAACGELIPRERGKLQQDPTEKKGVIGLFCRSYTIEDAIEELLPEVYLPTGIPGRYTYVGGSTQGGLITYEGKFAYSFHGTDPAQGTLCNAFDLVRIHKFNGGATIEADTKSDKSVTLMREFALGLQPVKELAVLESVNTSGFEVFQTAASNDDIEDWTKKLELDEKGAIKSTVFNVHLILRKDDNLSGRLITNEFSASRCLTKGFPGHRAIDKIEPIRDSDYSFIRGYLETMYGIVGQLKIDDGLALEFERNKFNPIKDYLDSLSWDGTHRIDTTLQKVLGVEDNAYTREVLKCWMTAAVSRVYKPGTKFDEMLVLVGKQGTGKSTFLRKLGMQWYSDSFYTVTGKEAAEQLQGTWIMEMAELSAFKKAEAEAIKHFISKTSDRYRPAYGRTLVEYERQVVFAGTTNERDFLTDSQNRRYWTVSVIEKNIMLDVWSDEFDDMIPQLWAEAVHNYKHGGTLLLSKDAYLLAVGEQESHRVIDDRMGAIEEYLNLKLPKDWETRDLLERRAWLYSPTLRATGTEERTSVSVIEVWCECLYKELENASSYNTRDINKIMKVIQGWSNNGTYKRTPLYGKQRVYEKDI